MKILFINRINDRSESALGIGLAEKGHSVTYIGEPADPDIENYKKYGITVIPYQVKNRLDIKAVSFFRDILKNEEYDVVYCPAARPLSPLLVAAGKKSNVKFVTYRGTLTTLSFLNPLDRLAHLSDKVSAVVCNSQAVIEKMREFGVKADKLKLIYKGHDVRWYQPTEPDNFTLNFPRDKKTIGCIANFRPTKGALVLIRAVSRLLQEGLQVRLCLVGRIMDPKIERLINKLKLNEHVVITGFRDDAISILKEFDVSVMPSLRKESLSRSIVESMFKRVPVIASNVGGMSELIKDGENGFIVPPGDDAKLAEKLKELLFNQKLSQSFTDNAFDFVSTQFSVQNYIDKFDSFFCQLRRS